MSVDASERLIDLVRANGDLSNHADGADEGMISSAERTLGVAFPPSYRRLVEEFGTWDIAGLEFLGVYRTPGYGPGLLGSVAETLDMRRDHGLAPELIVVMFDGMGGAVVLDSSRPDDSGEYPVLAWSHADKTPEKLGDDFGSFALALCARSVYREGAKLPIDSAITVAQDLLGVPGSRRKPPAVDEVVSAIRGFEAVAFAVPDGTDTDGFLFEYSEVNWLSEPMFAVRFVRQMQIVDAAGEHDEYSQVSFEFHCRVDVDLRSVGSRAVWWFRSDGTDFEEWLASVTRDPVWRVLRRKEIAEFVLTQESV
ncbi:SMI1/KNR4 family protein [Amycolatopsis roodepoortensis]|uniref:SMI1/KNR4 family protein n=1 Tax=Amycolatopsis roodepoortensis TaxID=700274 RepID=UPI0017894F32|nr:SMI1/KNR4 family protein [Amycolatopsis roodepoortensis]